MLATVCLHLTLVIPPPVALSHERKQSKTTDSNLFIALFFALGNSFIALIKRMRSASGLILKLKHFVFLIIGVNAMYVTTGMNVNHFLAAFYLQELHHISIQMFEIGC
jgi:hypothetical protein